MKAKTMSERTKASFVVMAIASVASSASFGASIVNVSSLSGLQGAIDGAPSAGRTIQLAKGTYDQSSTINVTNKNNITIEGATSNFNDTVIKGRGINNSSLGINLKVNHSNNVSVQNMTLRDSYYHGIQVNDGSNNFTARHVQTLDNGESGFKITSQRSNGDGRYSDGGTIENSTIGFTNRGQRNVVEGIDIVGAKNWNVRGNTIHNIKKAGGGPAYAAFAKGNSQGVVFEDNTVKDSFIGLSFGGGGTGAVFFRNGKTKYETRGGVIRNNTIYDLSDSGIYLNKAKNFKVYGNTVLRNGARTGAIVSRFSTSNGVIRDNETSGPIKLRNGGTAIIEANCRVAGDTSVPSQPGCNKSGGGDQGGGDQTGGDQGGGDQGSGDQSGGDQSGGATSVPAPTGWAFLSLFALAFGTTGLVSRRRFNRAGVADRAA